MGDTPALHEARGMRLGARERLPFVDALRVAIIAMVIVHHAAQPYGPTGGFWPVSDPQTSHWFRPFYTVNAAVGLGLLFLLAGYFVPSSYDRRGPRAFAAGRWGRIGVPLVVFALAVNVPLVYLAESRPAPLAFVESLYAQAWQPLYLHLWFLGHLLLYSAAYVAWRLVSDRRGRQVAGTARPSRWLRPPGHLAILGFVVVLAGTTWVVRWWYQVDEWVPLLLVLTAEPAKMPQYVLLFAAGVLAYRGDWLRRLPTRVGAVWLGVGLAASAVVLALEPMGLWVDPRAVGGFTGPSLVRSTLEALIGAGLSVGLVVLFRHVVRRPSRVVAGMAAASYAAYILHPFVVVALQAPLTGLAAPAVVKFALVAVAGVVLSFGAAHLSGRVPGLRVVLGTSGVRSEPRAGA